MSFVYGLTAAAGVALILLYMSKYRWEIKLVDSAVLLAAIAFVVRVLACFVSEGFPETINTYRIWSDMLRSGGIESFKSVDAHTGFQPGYMYVLYVLGHIRHFFRIPDGFAQTMLIKMPAILADCVICLFIYKAARRKSKKQTAWLISLFWVFNPASVFISSVLGQTESFYLIFLLLAVYRLTTKNYAFAYAFYAIALMLRPQNIIFMPLFIYSFYDYFKSLEKVSAKTIAHSVDRLFPGLLIILCMILPFSEGFNLEPVFRQFTGAFWDNSHISVNAANLYILFGLNWADGAKKIFGVIPFWALSLGLTAIIMLISLSVVHGNKRDDRYFFAGAFISVMVFMLGIKMNERSLLPATAFLLTSLAVRFKDEYLFMYCAFSLSIFVNCAAVLSAYTGYSDVFALDLPLGIIAGINIGITIFFIIRAYINNKNEKQWG